MTVKELHREAMRFNDLALIAKFENDTAKAKELYKKAFELEKQAFLLYNQTSTEEPTRSILIRSAANLALHAEEPREAEKLVAIGLAGDPPEDIANELRDLLQQINFLQTKKRVFNHIEEIILKPDIDKIQAFRGYISQADTLKREIGLMDEGEKIIEIHVSFDFFDIIKSYFNTQVIIKGVRKNKKIELIDIEKA